MTYYRASYLPSTIQENIYTAASWPRTTIKSYAPRAREGYARGNIRSSYAPRVPTLVRQDEPMAEMVNGPVMDNLAAA